MPAGDDQHPGTAAALTRQGRAKSPGGGLTRRVGRPCRVSRTPRTRSTPRSLKPKFLGKGFLGGEVSREEDRGADHEPSEYGLPCSFPENRAPSVSRCRTASTVGPGSPRKTARARRDVLLQPKRVLPIRIEQPVHHREALELALERGGRHGPRRKSRLRWRRRSPRVGVLPLSFSLGYLTRFTPTLTKTPCNCRNVRRSSRGNRLKCPARPLHYSNQ